ncbi:PP2C family protein-serine/threonine phosphatase [Leptospira inadai]|uniref:Protein phosphatase n=1 Tax=Leptospira inadai serovar Lyme TaxID=293084 RepID=A0ABX4YFR5_9LEPT|nr:protein phosphatase [Leptospira inadai serovar Lyme]
MNVFFIIFSIFLLFQGNTHASPLQSGIFEISGGEREVVSLEGNWQFVYGSFIDPKQTADFTSWGTLSIPESWQGKTLGNKILPREGIVTLRLILHFSPDSFGKDYQLFLPDFASAYRLYIDGKLTHSSGIPSADSKQEIPRLKPVYISIRPNSSSVEILLQGSNWVNNFGGFWQVPKIGTASAMELERTFVQSREAFLFGGLLLIGLYHIGLFLFRRKELSILYFAIFCFLLSLRIILVGNRLLLDILPEFAWDSLFRLEFFSFYSAVPIFLLFLHSLFPLNTHRSIVIGSIILSGIYNISLLFPLSFFTKIIDPFQMFIAFCIVYTIAATGIAAYRKQEDAILFLGGFIAFGITVAMDLIWDRLNIRGMNLSPYGLLLFTLCQSLVLSRRIARAFRKSEELTENLQISNNALNILKDNLEALVLEKTSELNRSLDHIRRDLLVAQSIQKKIFPENSEAFREIRYSVKYLPKDEVGGDFYDLFEISPGIFRVFLADATGHGVQAALVTMAIKAEYEGIKYGAKDPAFCLYLLDDKFQRKFSSLGTIFSSFIVDIYAKEDRIVYASAGHPDQILLLSSGLSPLRRTGAIIGLRNNKGYENAERSFRPGDRLFLFSDGVFEQFNSRREAWGERRLQRRLAELSKEPIETIPDIVLQDIEAWLGQTLPQDDISLIAVERV